MTPEMLRALHLLRDARRYGWKLSSRGGPMTSRFVTFDRHDDDGRHWVRFDLGRIPKPGESFAETYRSDSFVVNTPDGELVGNHLGIAQAVRVLRAYSGIGSAPRHLQTEPGA